MNILEILLGQVPEAVFFALFLILTKQLKEKRILFITIMIVEYVLLLNIFPYNWYFHISLTLSTFLTLKVLYHEKSQVTDIFILLIGYIVLTITSALCFVLCQGATVIATILNRVIIFGLLFCFRNKLYNIQKLYKNFWNRSDKPKATNSLEYLIYKYRFKDNKTFSEIGELLDLDNPRIVEKLDKIAFAIRLYCGI